MSTETNIKNFQRKFYMHVEEVEILLSELVRRAGENSVIGTGRTYPNCLILRSVRINEVPVFVQKLKGRRKNAGWDLATRVYRKRGTRSSIRGAEEGKSVASLRKRRLKANVSSAQFTCLTWRKYLELGSPVVFSSTSSPLRNRSRRPPFLSLVPARPLRIVL